MEQEQIASGVPEGAFTAPLPPPPPMPAALENDAPPGPPPIPSGDMSGAPAPAPPPIPSPEDIDMEMDVEPMALPPPPPPPPPQDHHASEPPAMAPDLKDEPGQSAGSTLGPITLPAPPITLPAPGPVPSPPPAPVEQAQQVAQQAGEMSEDQYNAMTPEQQAAYWHQWQQYSAQQYYTAAPDPQQQHYDPAAQYAQDPQYAAQYAQYQYAQPDAQQWSQYAMQPQQQYVEQQPDYAYYYQQQAQHQPQGLSQPYPPQATLGPRHHVQYSAAPDSSAAYAYPAAVASAASYGAGLGVPPLEVPQLAPPKKALPDWLRQEMLKRGIGLNAQAASKQGSDSDSELDKPKSRRLAQAGGSRWAGDEGVGHGVAGRDGSSSEEDEGKVSRAEELRRERLSAVVKSNLTGILLEVTDSMFEEIARKALSTGVKGSDDPGKATQETAEDKAPAAAVVLNRADDTEGSSDGASDALGLGYGSDNGSGSETGDSQDAKPSASAAEEAPKAGSAAEETAADSAAEEDAAAQMQLADSATEEAAEAQTQATSAPAHTQHAEQAPASVRDHAHHQKGQSMGGASGRESKPGDNADPNQAGAGHSAGISGKDAEKAPEARQSLANGKAPASLYSKGSSVWYTDKDSNRQPAVVVAVDVTHPPPSYCIRLDGADRTRDTEEDRLEPRAAQTLPEPAQGQEGIGELPAGKELPGKHLESSKQKAGDAASDAPAAKADPKTKTESKKKTKEKDRQKDRGKDEEEDRKQKSVRGEEKARKTADTAGRKEDGREHRSSRDEGRRGDRSREGERARDDRKRGRSSRSLSRSRSRERHRRQRSPNRERRRDSDRRQSSRSTSRERRRRRFESRSPDPRKRKSDSGKDKRGKREKS